MKHIFQKTAPLFLVGLVAGCSNGGFDIDLRDMLGGGFDTSAAANGAKVTARPKADSNGIISYPNYQVAVARKGDTLTSLADRIGADAAELGRYNGVAPAALLREGEVIALPRKVETAAKNDDTPIALTPTIVDVTELASTAIDQAPTDAPRALPAADEPVRHKVAPGETAYSIARLYNVPAAALGEWNGLDSDLAVRNGQFLIIPVVTAGTAAATSMPGNGSSTPLPPSSKRPQPRPGETAAATSAVAATTAAASSAASNIGNTTAASAKPSILQRPVSGSIIRDYKKGRNEGIDISAKAGTSVKAADAGVVAAVTKDTNGVSIVVIKHSSGLLTVYTNVDKLQVKKGDSVKRGQTIAKVRAGDPSFLHFEVRDGLNSKDPNDYI